MRVKAGWPSGLAVGELGLQKSPDSAHNNRRWLLDLGSEATWLEGQIER